MITGSQTDIEAKSAAETDDKISVSGHREWLLYILECSGGRLYTGITVDLEARFRAHMAGKGAKFTRSFKPQRIVFVRRFSSRAEAQREEYALKRLSTAAKRALIGAEGVASPIPISSGAGK